MPFTVDPWLAHFMSRLPPKKTNPVAALADSINFIKYCKLDYFHGTDILQIDIFMNLRLYHLDLLTKSYFVIDIFNIQYF